MENTRKCIFEEITYSMCDFGVGSLAYNRGNLCLERDKWEINLSTPLTVAGDETYRSSNHLTIIPKIKVIRNKEKKLNVRLY
jgi:hypothetical protein